MVPNPAPGDGIPGFVRALGWDMAERAVLAAQGNLKESGLESKGSVALRDFFEGPSLAPMAAGEERWLLVNPPYGERLGVGDARSGALTAKSAGAWYARLAQRAEDVARPHRAGLLLPARANPRAIRWPREWKPLGEPIALSNGGIPVLFMTFVRHS